MGGMIAQEFALKYPETARSLILTVTHCGGLEAVSAKPEVLVRIAGRRRDHARRRFLECAFYIR